MPLSIKVDELKNNIMKSTIRIKQDWEKNEPYIQLKLDMENPNEEVDLADSALIHFVQRANKLGLELVYQNGNEDNRSPQIRLKEPEDLLVKKFVEAHSLCESENDLIITFLDFSRNQHK